MITRRLVLAALGAASLQLELIPAQGTQGGAESTTKPPKLDPDAVTALAKAYTEQTGDPVEDDVPRRLFRDGKPNATAIQAAARKDFSEGRLFTHDGWRLSHTEGQLFVLWSRAK